MCGPKKVHMAGIANTIANAINRLDMIPTCKVSQDILKGLDENDCIHIKQVHFTKVLSKLLQDNTDLGTSIGCYVANISDVVEDITFNVMVEITCEERSENNLQVFYNNSSE